MTFYVYGDTAGNYYGGRTKDGKVNWEINYPMAILYTEETKDAASDPIEIGLNLYSFEVPTFPELVYLGAEEERLRAGGEEIPIPDKRPGTDGVPFMRNHGTKGVVPIKLS